MNHFRAIAWAGLFVSACGEASEKNPPLEAGAAVAVITPVVEEFEDLDGDGHHDEGEAFTDLNDDGIWNPVWIGGYGSERNAIGVHDDLCGRVLVLQKGDLRIGIVSVDWVGLMHDHALELQQAADEAGLDFDQVVISSTHNHEGPDTVGLWGPVGVTGRDEDYIAESRDRMVDALGEAIDGLAPVSLRAGVGRTEGLTDDSRLPEVLDEKVTALRFDRADGTGPVATVVHWSNHPEVLDGDNQWITADFPGYLVAELEAADPGTVGIYWQGIVGGLLNPLHSEVTDEGGNVLPHESWEKAERYGQLVSGVALDALEQGEDATGGERLAYREKAFFVPLDNLEMKLAGIAGLFKRTLYDEHGRVREPAEVFNLDPPYMQTEVTVLDVGEVQIATVPGELYPELALAGPNGESYYQEPQDPGADFQGTPCAPPIHLSMRETPYRIVLGLANDEVGYIIPKCQFDRKSPYAYGRDEPQYGESVSVGPDMAPILNAVLAGELEALNTGQEY